ncbi:hypothetical protein [Pseudooceanicola sp.]|uniref:hypothetical protein n=1 Tax=Pseudooceanicola sp. TaxID=1914328 RepID=UPI002615A7A2|nr:hypothetical protein [Pseudooceanicola sp.]MDF1854801.1 hypothetical protein [Pseudooceanicola sp.]
MFSPQFDPGAMIAMPVRYIQFTGALAERQLRLMTEARRAVFSANPFLLALAEMQTLNVLTEIPTPAPDSPPARSKPSTKAAPGSKGSRRQPASPPPLPV